MKVVYRKINSMIVIIAMLLTALGVMFASISVAQPGSFSITRPANNDYVSGVFSVTWGSSTNATWYIVRIDGTQVANTTGTTYSWDTSNYNKGTHTINVSAHNSSGVTYATENDVTVKVIGVPGVNAWQNSNSSVGTPEPIATATSGLKYWDTSDHPSKTVNISVNSSANWENDVYYLYYPCYIGQKDGAAYSLTWKRWMPASGPAVSFNGAGPDYTLDDIKLNVSGMWIIDNASSTTDADTSTNATFNERVPAWFWVNLSKDYEIGSIEDFNYNSTGTFEMDVTDNEGSVACDVDIRFEEDGKSVFGENKYESDGSRTVYKNDSYFEYAGNYTAHAYLDADDTDDTSNDDNHFYRENNMDNSTTGWQYFNVTYGANSGRTGAATWLSAATKYNWTLCGPWDPPEYNATQRKFVVNTGELTWSIPTANNTMYWGFDGEVNITAQEPNGRSNITNPKVLVYNESDGNLSNLPGNTTYFNQNYGFTVTTSESATDGIIRINSSSWGHDSATPYVWGNNGTWYAYISKDSNNDGWEEWNCTVEWIVTSMEGVLRFQWVDDDGNLSNDNTDGEIPLVPAAIGTSSAQPVKIKFNVLNSDHEYLGDPEGSSTHTTTSVNKAKENITLSGDALYLSSKTLDQLPVGMVWYDGSNWWVNLTPKMNLNGGEIKINIDWGSYGSHEETLSIGGTLINGSIVTVSPTEFPFNENVTISVTVTGPTGVAIPNANVYLFWLNASGGTGDLINKTSRPDTVGGNTYSFWFNTTQQRYNQTQSGQQNGYSAIKAPRNITAYAAVANVGNGYALTRMNAVADLKVTCSHSEIMAGEKIPRLYFNTTVVDATGNTTGYPEDSGLKVRLYNETGDDVTGQIGITGGWTVLDGDDNKTVSNKYITTPGTYTIHAYNNTHESLGENNATLVVTMPDVSTSLEEIIWGVDKNVSCTFTVTYKGEPLNGTLRIDNISKIGAVYNKTWVNTSFNNGTGTDRNAGKGNTSRSYTVKNGDIIVYNITANNLSEWKSGAWKHYSRKNITFYFKSKVGGSAWARATGVLPVKIADVSASPSSIPYNKPAEVELTVSGRGVGLENVWVSLIIPGLTGEMNTTTDADGKATFAFTPPTTGTIEIRIENRTSDTTIPVTSWSLYLDIDTQANEGVDFTVTVRNATAAGAAIADAAVTFNRETKTTDSSGQVTFTAPTVTIAREYTIVATKDGYAEASESILILNIPKLIIVVVGEVTAGSTFDIVIADDAGNAIVGATISIDDKTYTTGAQGIATITAPSKEGTYTIKATFPGYEDADPIEITIEAGGIPGFELLTLIAALGVAFILFRRRRK